MDEKDVAHGQALSTVKKQSASVIQQKTQIIRELRTNVKEMEELAIDVAVEQLDATKKLEVLAAKEDAMRETVNTRLMKCKNLQERKAELKTIIETDRELMQEQVTTLLAENHLLKEQLETKTMELKAADHDLNKACEEIHVSEICDKFLLIPD